MCLMFSDRKDMVFLKEGMLIIMQIANPLVFFFRGLTREGRDSVGVGKPTSEHEVDRIERC